jgi:cytochrome P450
MQINGVASGQIMTAVVGDLYRKAANPDFKFPLQIQVVDQADVAKAIFMAPEEFVKNYGFMESLSVGRFSASGEDWKQRAALTQSFYTQSTVLLDESALMQIYAHHLQAGLQRDRFDLFEIFIHAALEVFSKSFGLPNSIPWPMDLVNKTRAALIDQQAMAWIGVAPELMEQSRRHLTAIFAEFEALWQVDPALQALLSRLETQAKGIENFSAVGELLQNVFASTETTSSGLLWAIECMTRQADLSLFKQADQHVDELVVFLDEVLRVFTPVPYVSRVCKQATAINGMSFAENEPIVISIVGVHSDPQYWHEPLLFKPRRQEFLKASYPRHAYIPFINGPRVCAGMKLAKQELKCGMLALLDRFLVKPCNEPRGLEYGLASRPSVKLEPYLIDRKAGVV